MEASTVVVVSGGGDDDDDVSGGGLLPFAIDFASGHAANELLPFLFGVTAIDISWRGTETLGVSLGDCSTLVRLW